MKLSLLLTLVLATAAQDDTQTAAQQSQGSDDQAATQQQGYGSDVESAYGSEVESYAAPAMAVVAPVHKQAQAACVLREPLPCSFCFAAQRRLRALRIRCSL